MMQTLKEHLTVYFQGYSEYCSVSLPVKVFLTVDAEQMCPGERVYQPPPTLLIYLSYLVTENTGSHF